MIAPLSLWHAKWKGESKGKGKDIDVYYYAQISQLIITREIENNKAVLSQGEPRDAGFCTHDTTPIPP